MGVVTRQILQQPTRPDMDTDSTPHSHHSCPSAPKATSSAIGRESTLLKDVEDKNRRIASLEIEMMDMRDEVQRLEDVSVQNQHLAATAVDAAEQRALHTQLSAHEVCTLPGSCLRVSSPQLPSTFYPRWKCACYSLTRCRGPTPFPALSGSVATPGQVGREGATPARTRTTATRWPLYRTGAPPQTGRARRLPR